jgi:hypothetical protein
MDSMQFRCRHRLLGTILLVTIIHQFLSILLNTYIYWAKDTSSIKTCSAIVYVYIFVRFAGWKRLKIAPFAIYWHWNDSCSDICILHHIVYSSRQFSFKVKGVSVNGFQRRLYIVKFGRIRQKWVYICLNITFEA